MSVGFLKDYCWVVTYSFNNTGAPYIVTCEKQRISAYRISNGQNPPIKFCGFALTSPKTCIYYTTIRMGIMIDVVHTIQSS